MAKASKSSNSIIDSYLVAYNITSLVGWAYLLAQTTAYLLENGLQMDGLFGRIGYALIYIQTGALLEVLHSLLGLVRSGVMTALVQVYSRLLLVWVILYPFDVPEIRSSPALASMVLAWSITECVRYSNYACSLVGIEVPVLQYLRYTMFYVLYPIGVSSEMLEMWAALPHMGAIRPAFKGFLILNIVNYPFFFFKLYTHMIRQRRKVLGVKAPAAAVASDSENKKTTTASKKKKL